MSYRSVKVFFFCLTRNKAICLKLPFVIFSKVVLRDIARFHSIHLDDVAHLISVPWMCVYSGSVMKALSEFWRALLRQNHESFPEMWTRKR